MGLSTYCKILFYNKRVFVRSIKHYIINLIKITKVIITMQTYNIKKYG